MNVDDPDSTEILLPARVKGVMDRDTVNKLSGIHRDFREFLRRIRIDMTGREARKECYDRVMEKEELIELLAKRKLSF